MYRSQYNIWGRGRCQVRACMTWVHPLGGVEIGKFDVRCRIKRFRAPLRFPADRYAVCRTLPHRERGWGDRKMSSPGFPGVKQRVPGCSLLASSRVLGPHMLASMKLLRTRTRHEQCWAPEPFFGFSTGFWDRFLGPTTGHFHTSYSIISK